MICPAVATANDLLRICALAQQNDPTIMAARYARDTAIENVPKARSLLLPQLGVDYAYTYSKSNSGLTVQIPALRGISVPASVGISSQGGGTDLSVSFSQSLLNLQGWYLLKQADQQAALSQLTYRGNQQSLLLRVADAYFGLLDARQKLRSANAEREAYRRQLDLAREHLKIGLSSLMDVQEVQARFDTSVTSELEAREGLVSAQERLLEIIEEPSKADAPTAGPSGHDRTGAGTAAAMSNVRQLVESETLAGLEDDIPLPRPDPPDVAQWLARARTGNLDLLAAKLNVRIAWRGVEAARAAFLPNLAATVLYSADHSFGGGQPSSLSGTFYGVGVTLPLFDGGGMEADLRQAEASSHQKQAEAEVTERALERTVRTAYQDVVIGAARVGALKQAVTSNNAALDAVQTGFSLGTRSMLDVLSAEQQSFAVTRNYQQSRYSYLVAILQLKSIVGELTMKDIAMIDALLVGR